MLLLLSVGLAAATVCPGPGPGPCEPCEVFEVNLDLAVSAAVCAYRLFKATKAGRAHLLTSSQPRDRWATLVVKKAPAIKALIGILRPMFKIFAPVAVNELVHAVNASMPSQYVEEMNGIATALASEGIDFTDVMMANLFYEITGVTDTPLSSAAARSCTSMVAQRENGTVFLARNQDYPPPFTLVMVHAVFTRGGRIVYEGTTYAGTIGLSTAMTQLRPGWGVSINARGNPLKGTAEGLVDAIAAARLGGSIFPVLVRQAMDDIKSGEYSDAIAYLSKHPMIMPGYLIVGGARPGEGAIITRNASAFAAHDSDIFSLNDRVRDGGGGGWYVVQTNTDHWRKAPGYPGSGTSRRKTATDGLDRVTEQRVDLASMWGVLSTSPTYNAATIHTDLVAPAWGEYQTFKRHGPL